MRNRNASGSGPYNGGVQMQVSSTHSIRKAHLVEHRLVRRLVPQVFASGSAPELLLVAVAPDGAVHGAAAIAWRAWGDPPGFPLFVHVEPEARRCGLGRALLRAASDACRGETLNFHGWDALDEESPGAHFALANGFRTLKRTLHFEAGGAELHGVIASIRDRLQARGRVPVDAGVVSLASVSPEPVARLVSGTFGSRYETCLGNMRGGSGYDRENSVVLVHRGEVAGALLYRWGDGVPEVDVNVVAPSLRGGWANVLLLERATRNGLAAGATRFRFRCEERVRDTMNLAQRMGAALARTTLEVCVPIERPHSA